ncbi:hypothetical protein ANN_13219 [Periplaneta americana]|uniref:Uncharacterized protein n=1 Tax=Periplaneta americana TaxID=6978 RepID=A0ABQ8TL13_PERAM|nr:hypothetical protein ANN_13219 [Periplaneta americana]
MKPRIRHRLPDIRLPLGKTSEKNQPGSQRKRESNSLPSTTADLQATALPPELRRRGNLISGGPPAWGLGEALTTHHRKKELVAKPQYKIYLLKKWKNSSTLEQQINDTRGEIKRRINMGNACYYSVEKLLSSSLLPKMLIVRIKKKTVTILPVVLYGCETWTLTLTEEQRLRVFENKVLSKIFGAKRDEVTGEWRKLNNAELHALYSSPNIIRNTKSRRLRWAGHVAPRFPDLTPLHFFVWGFIKEKVYATEITDRDPLFRRINAAATDIRLRNGLLDVVHSAVRDRAQACLRANGGYFEQLLQRATASRSDGVRVNRNAPQPPVKFCHFLNSMAPVRNSHTTSLLHPILTLRSRHRTYRDSPRRHLCEGATLPDLP